MFGRTAYIKNAHARMIVTVPKVEAAPDVFSKRKTTLVTSKITTATASQSFKEAVKEKTEAHASGLNG